MFSHKSLRIGTILSGLLLTGLLSAADPVPSIEFDFATNPDKEIRTNSIIEFGKNIKREGDALIFDGSANSYAKVITPKLENWRKSADLREFSAAFKIRFDKPLFGGASNANTASLGFFDCRLTKDNYLEIELFTKPTELTGDKMVLRSVDKVPYGKWVHVELIYDTNRQIYELYLNGKFQFCNDEWTMPLVKFNPLILGDGFKGAIADFRLYEAPLQSEELALTDKDADWFKGMQKKIESCATTFKNTYLKQWANDLAKRADDLSKNPARVTIAQEKRLQSELDKINALSEGITTAKGALNDRALTTYQISATSQNAILPNELPKEGRLTNHIQIAMAQDEFESTGIVVVPFTPFKNFKPVISDLKNGNNVIKASDVDIKILKRMYRAGGAWMTYHCDIRSRILVPDLLLNDDEFLLVDNVKRANYLKVQYPTGTVYTDVSRFLRNKENMGHNTQFVKDADTLQPLQIKDAGQNQEFIFTFHATKDTVPGFYDGTISFLNNGTIAATIKITVHVLPFALPEPKTNYDLTKSYYTHINGFASGSKERLKDMMDHNFRHASGLDNERNIRIAKEIGYPMTELVGTVFDVEDSGWRFNWNISGLPDDQVTPEMARQMDKIFLARVMRSDKKMAEWIGNDNFMRWVCTSSEASNYWAVYANVDRVSNLCRENTKIRFFTHGGEAVQTYGCGGPIDMNSHTVTKPQLADKWHVAGGRIIFYAYPFPGPENPNWFRRALGLEAYLANYDGHMMHGFCDNNFNEFAYFYGGDGNYRTFSLAVDQHDGKIINRLCIIGCREAYDDVRYATLLQQQAKAAMQSKDAVVVREAKRQLTWLNEIDRKRADMDDFRTGCQWRILTLKNLIENRAKGK